MLNNSKLIIDVKIKKPDHLIRNLLKIFALLKPKKILFLYTHACFKKEIFVIIYTFSLN
jgi:hypothetical protein